MTRSKEMVSPYIMSSGIFKWNNILSVSDEK